MSIEIKIGRSGKVYVSVKTDRGNAYQDFSTLDEAMTWAKSIIEWAKE